MFEDSDLGIVIFSYFGGSRWSHLPIFHISEDVRILLWSATCAKNSPFLIHVCAVLRFSFFYGSRVWFLGGFWLPWDYVGSHVGSIRGALCLWKNNRKGVTVINFRGFLTPSSRGLSANRACGWVLLLTFCRFGWFCFCRFKAHILWPVGILRC